VLDASTTTAYRPKIYHSELSAENGDGIVFGASLTQPDGTVAAIKAGPLPDDTTARIDGFWPALEGDAEVDSLSMVGKLPPNLVVPMLDRFN
jgi:hypothetical protein